MIRSVRPLRTLLLAAAAAGGCGVTSAKADDPATAAVAPDPTPPFEAELSTGHESSSSPLFRFSPEGALVYLPGRSHLSGFHRRAMLGATATGQADGVTWSLAGRGDLKRVAGAQALDLDMWSGSASLHAALGAGLAGVGLDIDRIEVGGAPFRRSTALMLDWTMPLAGRGHASWMLQFGRQRHAGDFVDLDAKVTQLSFHGRVERPWAGIDGVELLAGLGRERNRHGFRDLSNDGRFLRVAGDREALGIDWSAAVMWQRANFLAGLDDVLTARRDRSLSLEAGAAWSPTPRTTLRVGLLRAVNRSSPALYANTYRLTSVSWSARW